MTESAQLQNANTSATTGKAGSAGIGGDTLTQDEVFGVYLY